MFKYLDPLLRSQPRLQIISLLMTVGEASFNYLLAGYITVSKQFKDNYPLTTCAVTGKGKGVFAEYVKAIEAYLRPKERLLSALGSVKDMRRLMY